MNNLQLPQNNNFVNKILTGWFGLRAGYLEFQKSKKVAEAMAGNEANKVKIAGEIEEKFIREQMQIIDNLEQADRFIEYKNLHGVLTKAVPQITYMGNEERIDPDKLKRLKDLSKEFSSDDMQEYIAGILAGEYNQPGSYSLQTMSIVKNLSKDEIEIFRKFSGLFINGYFIPQDFVGNQGDIFRKNNGIPYQEFLFLQELGLIAFKESSMGFPLIGEGDMSFGQQVMNIGNKHFSLKYKIKKSITIFTITNVGREIMQIVKGEPPIQYFDWIESFFKENGFEFEYLGGEKTT